MLSLVRKLDGGSRSFSNFLLPHGSSELGGVMRQLLIVVVLRFDVHEHPEFIYGTDELNGYLRLSKMLVNSRTSPADLFQSEEKFSLQHLPGYVICDDCKGESFGGNLSGATFSYEYTDAGKVMAGRIYYLQVDTRTFYALRFTVAQDKLPALREQMNSIARSFRLKWLCPKSRRSLFDLGV